VSLRALSYSLTGGAVATSFSPCCQPEAGWELGNVKWCFDPFQIEMGLGILPQLKKKLHGVFSGV
jgi:hypothetical protein